MSWERTYTSVGAVPLTQVDATLRAARTIWLATTTPDGDPHVAPVWFLWDGNQLVFSTSARTRKGINLERNGHVQMHLGDGDDVIIARGTATTLPTALTTSFDDAYGAKYPQPRTAEPARLLPLPDSVAFAVLPDTLTAWVYGDMRTRTQWRRLQGTSTPAGLDSG